MKPNYKKKDEFTPWQTFQQITFSQKYNLIEAKVRIPNEAIDTLKIWNQQKLKKIKQPVKQDQNFRVKTEKQIEQREGSSEIIKNRKPFIKGVKPINSHLISILNTYNQKEINGNSKFQINLTRQISKKSLNGQNKSLKIKNLKRAVTHRQTLQTNPQKIQSFDIKTLKNSIIKKRNSSIETLLKIKQQIQNKKFKQEIPIIRKYSIQNMCLNTLENFNSNSSNSQKIQSIQLQKGIRNKITIFNNTTRQSKSNDSKTKTEESEYSEFAKRKFKKFQQRKQKLHILDRLYDRFN